MSGLSLKSNQIDLWVISFESTVFNYSDCYAVLSEPERSQAERFRFDDSRYRYVCTHARVRGILSDYLNTPPDKIAFSTNHFGKPFLNVTSNPLQIQFNLSHSKDLAVLAIAKQGQIGVDIEWVKLLSRSLRIAEKYFSPDEITCLRKVNPVAANLTFAQLWAGKEALIKARGAGLSLPLNEFSVAGLIQEGRQAWIPIPISIDETTWTVRRLELLQGYVGAIATDGKILDLNYFKG